MRPLTLDEKYRFEHLGNGGVLTDAEQVEFDILFDIWTGQNT